jgi:hypothetical protein
MAPSRTILVGMVVILSSSMLILSPFLLGANVISNTIVAFGLLAFIAGTSFVLHGAWDWIAPPSRKGRKVS